MKTEEGEGDGDGGEGGGGGRKRRGNMFAINPYPANVENMVSS